MRSQEKAILEAFQNGYNLEFPVFSFGEYMALASKVCLVVGSDPNKMLRKTVDAWLRTGVLTESKRTDRNRLFSALDVVRLAIAFHGTQLGLNIQVVAGVIKLAFEQFQEYWSVGEWEAIQPSPDSDFQNRDPRMYIVVSLDKGMHMIETIPTLKTIDLMPLIKSFMVTINWVIFFSLTIAFCEEAARLKGERLVVKMQRAIEAKNQKGS